MAYKYFHYWTFLSNHISWAVHYWFLSLSIQILSYRKYTPFFFSMFKCGSDKTKWVSNEELETTKNISVHKLGSVESFKIKNIIKVQWYIIYKEISAWFRAYNQDSKWQEHFLGKVYHQCLQKQLWYCRRSWRIIK